VTRDVPDHALVFGVPARQVGWVCCCGTRLGDDLTCGCGRRFTAAIDGLVETTDATGRDRRPSTTSA
jgi:UDP-2-acetamido-3-amino-2,3-dideoxy-glucuronate N-acetyltransferase